MNPPSPERAFPWTRRRATHVFRRNPEPVGPFDPLRGHPGGRGHHVCPRSSRWSATPQPPKRPSPKVADRVSGIFVPAVITIAVITTHCAGFWPDRPWALPWQEAFPFWSSAAPALWALPPRWRSWWATAWAPSTASMFKTAVSLEETGKIQIVALDKTGTITSGEPKVTDILPGWTACDRR